MKRGNMRFATLTGILLLIPLGLMRCASDDESPKNSSGGGGSTHDAAAKGGASGVGGIGGEGNDAASDANADADCPMFKGECCPSEYDLGADADTAGLCAPADSLGCNCIEVHAGSVECSPDGSVCCHSVNGCNPKPPCGWVECGQGGQMSPGCPASQQVFDQASQQGLCRACTTDAHCVGGKRCSWRLRDRMFCEP